MPDMPEWVQVWAWLRFIREPRDMTPLPQQNIPDQETMTMDDYETRRQDWIKAGSPSMTQKHLIAAMTGNLNEIEVPF